MAALTEPEVDLVLGLVGAAIAYFGQRDIRARRSRKAQLADATRQLIDSLQEQITYLRAELKRERRRSGGTDDSQ